MTARELAKPPQVTDNLLRWSDDEAQAVLLESSVMQDSHRRRRKSVRFRPVVDPACEGGANLERRLMLSADAAPGAHVSLRVHHARPLAHHVARVHATHATSTSTNAASGRVTPAQEINKQYQVFLQNFQAVEDSYVQTLNQQSTGTITVTTTLTAPYLAGTASMDVKNAAVFGPQGVFTIPVTATAQVGSVPVGTFTVTGSSGNTLAINTAQSSAVSLATGTVLTAQVTFSASASAGAIFPGYITVSSQALAVNLVSYFNTLPFKLPRMYAPPHQDHRAGAIQQYVYQIIAGSASTSLEQQLLAVALPLTPGGDLQIYDTTITTAINASRIKMLDSVQQIFANKLPVVPTTSSLATSGTGSTASTGTTGTGTTGTA